ncbi:hypothetical protein OUZ56_003167 [Daphnia magna]|uniref:Uncharacterized protein n=1 Tax=Daphnia magna TaxID=35525 RepID=A0ABR0A876_9CRUS|nr:hypothetical protein OUZ56_003167 [Daphnia magna]
MLPNVVRHVAVIKRVVCTVCSKKIRPPFSNNNAPYCQIAPLVQSVSQSTHRVLGYIEANANPPTTNVWFFGTYCTSITYYGYQILVQVLFTKDFTAVNSQS